jgi:hypothetical protein
MIWEPIRMDRNRMPRHVWETRIEGPRGKGRPRIKWEGHMQKLVRKKGKTL